VAHAIPDPAEDTATLTSVSDWLSSLGLAAYATKFSSRGLSCVNQLMSLSRGDLEAIGVANRQHVDMMLTALTEQDEPRHHHDQRQRGRSETAHRTVDRV